MINKRSNINIGKLSLMRSMFVIKFTKLLENDLIVDNVDEWLVNYKSGDWLFCENEEFLLSC